MTTPVTSTPKQICTDYMFVTPTKVSMTRTGTTGSILKEVTFTNPNTIDFITIQVNDCTEEMFVYYDDGHVENKTIPHDNIVYLDYTPAGDQTGFVVMLEQMAGCANNPEISYLNVTDGDDNPISHNIGAPSTDSFEAIFDQLYEYTVDHPNEYVRVMKIMGNNIGQISADVPFTSNTTDGIVHTVSFLQDVTSVSLTFRAHDATKPIYIESVTPTKTHFPHTILVDNENLNDMSNPQELFMVEGNSFIVTLSSTMGTLDWLGNLEGQFENVDNITVRAVPSGEVIQTYELLEEVEVVEMLLDVSVEGVTALEIELAPIDPTKPTWVGSFGIFACLDPYGKCSPESNMDGESNNLRIAVSDSHHVYDQYAYGALRQSDSAYRSHPDDDEVTIYLAAEDTIGDPTVNRIDVKLNNVKEATLFFYDENHNLLYQITKSVDPDGDYPNGVQETFDFDNSIEDVRYMQLDLVKRPGTDTMWASDLEVTACVTPKAMCLTYMDASNIAINVTRPGTGSAGTQVFDNNSIAISQSPEDIWIRVQPEAINSVTNSGAFYRVELELAEPGLVDSAWIILNNHYSIVADPGPQRVFLTQDQRKIKFQYNGKSGRKVDFMLRPNGSQAITVTNVSVEVCPIFEPPCPNPMFDMNNPYLFVTSDIPGGYSPFQALQGTDSFYTLEDIEETLTVTFNSEDEPELTHISFHGRNIQSVIIRIWRKDLEVYEEYTDLDMTRINFGDYEYLNFGDYEYFYFHSPLEEFGDKVEIIILKNDTNSATDIWGLNVVACYTPPVLCPEDMEINQITVMSNDTQSGQPYEEYFGEVAPMNLPLYNGGGPSTVEIHVKEEGTAAAQFWNVQVDVENAQEVILVLKDENGNNVSTIKVMIQPEQKRIYETFGGAEGNHIEIIVTPVPGENATLTGVVVDACAHKPPGACKLHKRTKKVTLDGCESTNRITYGYCKGPCLPGVSEYHPIFHVNVDEAAPDKLSTKDCSCCTGVAKSSKTEFTLQCKGGGTKTVFLQEYDRCECFSCPI